LVIEVNLQVLHRFVGAVGLVVGASVDVPAVAPVVEDFTAIVG